MNSDQQRLADAARTLADEPTSAAKRLAVIEAVMELSLSDPAYSSKPGVEARVAHLFRDCHAVQTIDTITFYPLETP